MFKILCSISAGSTMPLYSELCCWCLTLQCTRSFITNHSGTGEKCVNRYDSYLCQPAWLITKGPRPRQGKGCLRAPDPQGVVCKYGQKRWHWQLACAAVAKQASKLVDETLQSMDVT